MPVLNDKKIAHLSLSPPTVFFTLLHPEHRLTCLYSAIVYLNCVNEYLCISQNLFIKCTMFFILWFLMNDKFVLNSHFYEEVLAAMHLKAADG